MPKSRLKRSKVWERFVVSSTDCRRVECTLCEYTFKYNLGTTSTLIRHLKVVHPDDYCEVFGTVPETSLRPSKRKVNPDQRFQEYITSSNKKQKGNENMEQHFWMQWNNQSELFGSLPELLVSESYVDVTLFVDGQALPAHKLILSAASPYFSTLFRSVPNPHPVVFMHDVCYDHVKMILDFIYKGETMVSSSDLNAFLLTAKSLQITGLAGVVTTEPQAIQMVKVLTPSKSQPSNKRKEPELQNRVSWKDENEDPKSPERYIEAVYKSPQEMTPEEMEADGPNSQSLISDGEGIFCEAAIDIQDSGGSETQCAQEHYIKVNKKDCVQKLLSNSIVITKGLAEKIPLQNSSTNEQVYLGEDGTNTYAEVVGCVPHTDDTSAKAT